VEYILISCSHKAYSFSFPTNNFVDILILQMHATSQVHLIILDLTGLIILREQHKLQGQFYVFLLLTVCLGEHVLSIFYLHSLNMCSPSNYLCTAFTMSEVPNRKRKLEDLSDLNDLTSTVSRNCTAPKHPDSVAQVLSTYGSPNNFKKVISVTYMEKHIHTYIHTYSEPSL
jgi:hypothetical protein